MTTAKRRMSKRDREIMPSPRVIKPVIREGHHAAMSSNESTPKKSKISSDILLLGKRRQDVAAESSVQHYLINQPQADGQENVNTFNEVRACFVLALT